MTSRMHHVFRWMFPLIALGLLMIAIVPVRAASYSVTVAADTGGAYDSVAPYTLREAFEIAASGDTISLDAPGPFQLPATVDTGNRNLTINFNGQTVQANGNGARAFDVGLGGALALNGGTLTYTGAGAVNGVGGLINASGSLQISNMTLSNANSTGRGGAIYAKSPISIINSTLSNNTGQSGGGLYMETTSSGSISNVDFLNNTASEDGAGAVVRAVSIDGGTVSGNTGAIRGGGFWLSGQVLISGTDISNNTSTTNGGGIYADGFAQLKVYRNFIRNNTAQSGAAIYNAGKVDVINSTIYGNTATSGGSVLYNASNIATFSFVTMAGNSAVAVINANGNTHFRNSILDNASDNNCQVNAGAINDDDGNIDSGATCGFATGSASVSNTDPNLTAVSGYYVPNTGSPAINTVLGCTVSSNAQALSPYPANAAVTDDQRGSSRTDPAKCDKGAYETSVTVPSEAGATLNVPEAIVYEQGTTSFAYTISLTTKPSGIVEIDITDSGGQVTISPSSVQFNNVDWAIPKTVIVRAVDDTAPPAEPDPHTTIVSHTIDAANTTATEYLPVSIFGFTVTVRDNDSPYTVSLGSSAALNEGDSGTTDMTFNVTINTLPTGTDVVSAIYTTADSTATASSDYTFKNGNITFTSASTSTTQTITVPIIGDTVGEPDETFLVNITVVTGGLLGTSSATGTIVNDDANFAIDLSPENLPVGKTGTAYSTQIVASGGVAPYSFSLSGTLPDGISFDTATGIISGTSANDASATFTINVTDAGGLVGQRQYTLTFNATGTADSTTAGGTTVVPTATPLSPADIEATRVGSVRTTLGPPTAIIDPDSEIEGLSVRTGPMVGASLINVARPGNSYLVVGKHRVFGSGYDWYLIRYQIDEAVDAEGNDIIYYEEGWVSGRYLALSGALFDIPTLGNPFDAVNGGNTGVTGLAELKGNLYAYPTPSSQLVARYDEGSTFQILARTLVDRRDITYWVRVRLDRTGQVGWMPFVPDYMPVNGNLSGLPTY